jgi:hypothetical protein
MDIHDPELALRISLNPKVEGRISLGVPGAVRNRPSKWLIDNKSISMAQPRYSSFSPRRPLSDRPLTMILLRGGLDIRCIKHASSVKADLARKISPLH